MQQLMHAHGPQGLPVSQALGSQRALCSWREGGPSPYAPCPTAQSQSRQSGRQRQKEAWSLPASTGKKMESTHTRSDAAGGGSLCQEGELGGAGGTYRHHTCPDRTCCCRAQCKIQLQSSLFRN